MKLNTAVLATSSLIFLALEPVVASAQTAIADPNGEIAEIIVTAQKRAQALSDVGETVNVVNAQQLERQGVTTVADLTKTVSGFTVAENGDGTPIYTLRGVSFNVIYFGAQPTVSLYVDEAPLPFPVMTEGALLDLERVEVLKGPQGTLFGQNATAGAINYIANKPTDHFDAGVRASYGTFNTFQGEGYVSGPIAENLTARLSFGATESGPWQQSATRDATLGDQRKFASRLLLDWQPMQSLKFALNVNGWLDRSDTTSPQVLLHQPNVPSQASPLLYTTPITATSARNADWDPNQAFRRDNNFFQVALRADYDLGAHTTLSSLTDYTHARIDSLSDFDGTYLNFNTTRDEGKVSAISEELKLSGDVADGQVHYLLGGWYQHDESLENYNLSTLLGSAFANVAAVPGVFPGFGSFDGVIQHGIQSNRTVAGFANVDWHTTEQLTLSGGFRETFITHYSDGCTLDNGDGTAAAVFDNLGGALRAGSGLPAAPGAVPGGCVTLGPTFLPYEQLASFSENNLSWRGNANFKFNNVATLYGTVSRGFKGGNYPVPAASAYVQLVPVRQEELTAYEVGTKVRFFDRRLAFNASVYYYDYKDKQLETPYIDPVFGQLVHLANIPKSSVKGFDLDGTLIPLAGLTLRSALTLADSSVGHYAGFDVVGNPVSLAGHPFNYAPKWVSVSDAEYQHHLSGDIAGFVGATYTYNTKTYADLADSPTLEIRSFGLLDLRAGITSESRKWELMAFVHNVANIYTWSYARTGGDNVLRYANMPRTGGIQASYKFAP